MSNLQIAGNSFAEKVAFIVSNAKELAQVPNFEMTLDIEGIPYTIGGKTTILQPNYDYRDPRKLQKVLNDLTKGKKECVLTVGDAKVHFKGGKFMASQKDLFDRVTTAVMRINFGMLSPDVESEEYEEIQQKVVGIIMDDCRTFLNYIALDNAFSNVHTLDMEEVLKDSSNALTIKVLDMVKRDHASLLIEYTDEENTEDVEAEAV